MTKLKPCPLCGGGGEMMTVYGYDEDLYYMKCRQNCGHEVWMPVRTRICRTREEAEGLWNAGRYD